MRDKIKAEQPQECAAGILGSNMLPHMAHQENPAHGKTRKTIHDKILKTPPLQHQYTAYLKGWLKTPQNRQAQLFQENRKTRTKKLKDSGKSQLVMDLKKTSLYFPACPFGSKLSRCCMNQLNLCLENAQRLHFISSRGGRCTFRWCCPSEWYWWWMSLLPALQIKGDHTIITRLQHQESQTHSPHATLIGLFQTIHGPFQLSVSYQLAQQPPKQGDWGGH